MNKYIVNGQGINVPDADLDFFLEKYPNAEKYEEPTIEDPVVEENPASNWFADAWFAGEINADMYDDADNVFDIGSAEDARKLTDEELNTYIGLLQKSQVAAGEMKEAQKFAEAYNKYNNQGENMIMSTIMGVRDVGIKGFAQNMIQSMRGQFNLQQIGESTTAAVAGGAAGSFIPVVGTGIGAVTSAFAAANYGMETIHMFNELLEKEIKDAGLEFTPESIRKIMSDDDIRSRIKSKARARGGTIAAVEGFTSLLGIKGGAAIAKSGMRTTSLVGKTGRYLGAGAVNTTAEIVGGGGGEYLGAKAAGMEATGLDIVNEAFSGVATTAPISTAVSGISALASRPSYFVEGKKVTKKSLLDYTDRAQSSEELANLNFEIKNDPLLDADLKQKQLRANIDTQIDPSITDVDTRNKLIDLQIEKTKLEQDKSKFKISNTKSKLEKIDQDIENLISGITDVETTDVKGQLEKGVQQYSIQNTIKLLENEAGPIPNIREAFTVEDDNAAQAAFEKIKAEFGLEDQNVKGADGFIIPTPEGNVVIINKDIAGKKGQINVGGHELLHAIVQKHYEGLGDGSVAQRKFIDDFKNTISKKSLKYIQDIIDGRNKDRVDPETGETIKGEGITSYSDEYLTIYSDGIVKKQISYDESIGVKLKNFIQDVARKFGYNKEFGSGLDTYNFMRDYNKSIMEFNKLSDRAKAVAGVEAVGTEVKKSMTAAQKADVKQKVDKLGQIDKDGNNLREKGTGNFYYQAEADDVVKEIKEKGYLNALIRSQYKADMVPVNFVNDVLTQLTPDIKNFKPEQNESLFGYLQGRIKFRAGDVYNKIYKKTEQEKTAKDIGQTTKEGEVKIQVAAEKDVAMEELETKDIGIAAQIQERQAEKEGKKEVERQSKFRNIVGFKTGSQIYNEVLDAAKKSLIRAYAKTRNIKDVAARERAVVAEIQKEHNSLTSPLFKQIKNWLSYGKAQEVVTKGTKDIYLDNLREFREDITKLISTADLVQIERLVNESDRVFTRFKGQLTRKADVEQAVNEGRLPPDAIRKYDKDKKVNEYDKVIPGETEIVEFADQPGSIPSKKDPTKMVRSGLKGTRKDGIAKNIVNGLVLDAIMEARQSKDVQDKISQMDIDATSVQELGAAAGRPVDVKFSISISNTNIDNLKNILGKDINYTKLMGPSQIRKSRIAIQNIIDSIDLQGIHSSIIPAFETLKNNIESGLSFATIIDTTWNQLKEQGIGNYQMQALLHEGVFSKKHLNNLLAKAKRLTEVQIRQIAFQDAVTELQDNVAKAKTKDKKVEIIKNWLVNNSKSARTSKVIYNGKTITTNKQMFEEVIEPLGNLGFAVKSIKEGTKITHDGKSLNTYKKIIEIKQDPAGSTRIVKDEADQAKKWFFNILKSKISPEAKKARISLGAIDMVGPIRKMAELVGYITNAKGKTTLEHRVTINEITKAANKYIDNPTDKNLKAVEKQVDNSKVFLLPNDIVDVINKDYKTTGDLETIMNLPEVKKIIDKKGYEFVNDTNIKFSKSADFKTIYNAVKFSRSTNNPTKGITILDFDDTLATTKSLVKFTRPDGTTGTLNAEQYASTYEDLLEQGYKFDFSEFNKVVKGKLAPLFQKALKLQNKFGSKNMFVLTARPPAAQQAIFDFLKANGLNIPLENITGLGNSTAEAKALWIADKVGEGYNDFYFADDALQNVQAVDNMLEQFDVKRKVQQAKLKFSKSMNDQFNDILEDVTGIETIKRFSVIKARKRGASKGKFRFFIPPSHEDFVGLLYNFMGKGRKGDQHRNFFEKALVRPLNRAYREIDTAKQAIANDHKALNKRLPDVKKKLKKKTPDGDFIFEDAVRVYLWNKHGYDIPGLSETDQANLTELVMNDAQLREYAENINIISKQENYVDPGQGWEGGNIKTDLIDATGRVGRAEYFTEFNENADVLFSEENLNKIEAAYGADFRSALEDMLHRISTGINRPKGQHATVNKFMNYLNGSVGTVMFFNVRSAILQQMSIVNYINFADNNMFAAAKAFANQKQYWKDFAFIFNSDMLKQRRGGIGTDINGADLAQAVKGSKDPTKVVIGRLLKLGFLPTQIGDNIAIATGGATFYRNRVNKYIKDGLSKKEAETKAFTDFQDLTQSTQQSSRPDMTSQQQASWIGKLVLNFQNITSQYNRIIKKAALDIGKGRISPPYTTKTQSNLGNLSKILYYGAIQNVIFYSLQTALFAVMFDDDEDEDQILKKRERVINGSIDSILRGAGIYGAVASTLKNAIIKFKEQREKGYNKDESAVPMELLNFSPVVGIKVRQLVNAEKTLNYNENVISEMETFDADNPQWSAVTNYTQALTNFPANRLYQKSINMRNALDKDYTNFQRVLFFSGYTTWSLGLGDNEAIIEAKEKAKINKANTKKGRNTFKQRDVFKY